MKLKDPFTNKNKPAFKMTEEERQASHQKYLKDQATYLKTHRGYRMQGQ